jgi:hypothetical protein
VAFRDTPDWLSSSSSVSSMATAAGRSLILFVIYMASGKATGGVSAARALKAKPWGARIGE